MVGWELTSFSQLVYMLSFVALFEREVASSGIQVIGKLEGVKKGVSCNEDDGKDSILLTVQVKEVIKYSDTGKDDLVIPGSSLWISAQKEELWDVLQRPKPESFKWYMEVERGASSGCWKLFNSKPPLAMPNNQVNHSLSRRKRTNPTSARVVKETHCCYYGIGHFLRNKLQKDWCELLQYPPVLDYESCTSDASLCCDCCQFGYNVRSSHGVRRCGQGTRLGYKGSCLVLFRLCCYDRDERHFDVHIKDKTKGLVNATFTVYGNPTRVEWEILTRPDEDDAEVYSLFISIIESWAEATEVFLEPNGNRISLGLFNATLNVTFPNGERLNIGYSRSPPDDETHYSVVTDIVGSVPEDFDELFPLTTIYIARTREMTHDRVIIKGIASEDTVPKNMSIMLTAVFRPPVDNTDPYYRLPSEAVQLDINRPFIVPLDSRVRVTTTSTIRGISRKGLLAAFSCDLNLRLQYPQFFNHCNNTCIYNSWSGWSYTGIRNKVPESKCPSNSTLKYVRTRTASNESLQHNACEQHEQSQTKYDCEPTSHEKAIIIIQRLGLGADADNAPSTNPPLTPPTTRNCTNPSCSHRRSAEREHFPRYVRQSPDYKTCPTSAQQRNNRVCRGICTPPPPPSQTGKRSVLVLAQDEEIADKLIYKFEELDPLASVNPFNLDAFLQQKEYVFKRKKRCSHHESKIRYVLFILDTSGSIGRKNFKKVRGVVAKISRRLCDYLKMAVITYDDWINLEFCFNCYDTRSEIFDAINRIRYRRGPRTHTTDAIKCGCDILHTKCNLPNGINTPNIDVVVLTDGEHNGPCRSKLSQEIKCLTTDKDGNKRDNIKTYAIGIGSANIEAVAQLRQNPDEDYIFDVPDFDTLKGLFDIIEDLMSLTTTAENGEEVPLYSCHGHLGPHP